MKFGRTYSGAARIPGWILQCVSGNRALDRPTGALQTCVGSEEGNWNIQVINRLLAQRVFWRRVGTLPAYGNVTTLIIENGQLMLATQLLPEDEFQILIVDDEPKITEEISEKLEFHGFRCLTARDSRSGLALIRSQSSISIVLTDIRMPGMDGLEMCKKIGDEISAERDLVLVVMTGHAGLSEAIEALKVGALDFLTKPLSPDLLVHAIKRADQHIKARKLEREFNKKLTNLVRVMTDDLRKKACELETSNTALTISNQVKDEFVRMISHELRTPLIAIVGLSEVIKSKTDDPQQKGFIGKIEDAGWQLTGMVNSMLDMVAVETKTLQLTIDDVKIPELIEQSISAYTGKAKEAGITIGAPNISALSFKLDRVRISQAIGRLVDNAINISQTGDIVYVSALQTDDGLTISVQDDGEGMSQPDIEKCLKPLRQLDGSRSREPGGIGMGLSLAKMFAELHGGSLDISSKLGHGTTVKLIFPVPKD
ncbi:MAG: signal transduction histidine kinase [Candidatus Azotimanducaceae bacterium]|jgi:signal transduction histidine kinase